MSKFGKNAIILFAVLAASLAALFVWRLAPRGGTDEGPPSTPIRYETPYEFGYRRGYDAFCAQAGVAPPTRQHAALPTAVRYTSAHGHGGDESEMEKGYVDGYHRATELEYCPRSW